MNKNLDDPKYKIVFKMQFAIKMQLLGHKLLTTMPNPKDSRYTCWIFQDDKDFDSDLHALIVKGGEKHG